MWNWLKALAAAAGALVGWLFGELNGFFYALVAFVIIDYITGVIAAAYDKQLNSRIGFKGIAKKILIFLLVGVAHIIDAYILREGDMIRTAVLFFYLMNEGLSIIENAARIGLPVPDQLKNALEQLRQKKEEKKDGNND